MTSTTPTFWTPWRLRWYPRVVLGGMALGWLIFVVSADGPDALTGRVGGDYPAFYGAASIVADGDIDQLYDGARQLRAQEGLFPDDGPGYLHFAYPPYVAAALRPLALVDYQLSYVVYTLVMIAALGAAIWLARPLVPLVDRYPLAAMAAGLAFLPLFKGVGGGQNVAITVLLVVVAWRAVHDGNEIGGGVALGLLLYKPQFALPLMGLYLLRGHWKVAAAGVASGVVLYGAGAALMGGGWVGQWLDAARTFNDVDIDVNGVTSVSIPGTFEHLGWPVSAGFAIAIGLGMGLVWLWWKKRPSLAVALAVTAPVLVLMSPHSQLYEPGLMLLTVAIVADRFPADRRWLGLLWVAGYGHLTASALGFNPMIIVVAAVAVWAWSRLVANPVAVPA